MLFPAPDIIAGDSFVAVGVGDKEAGITLGNIADNLTGSSIAGSWIAAIAEAFAAAAACLSLLYSFSFLRRREKMEGFLSRLEWSFDLPAATPLGVSLSLSVRVEDFFDIVKGIVAVA